MWANTKCIPYLYPYFTDLLQQHKHFTAEFLIFFLVNSYIALICISLDCFLKCKTFLIVDSHLLLSVLLRFEGQLTPPPPPSFTVSDSQRPIPFRPIYPRISGPLPPSLIRPIRWSGLCWRLAVISSGGALIADHHPSASVRDCRSSLPSGWAPITDVISCFSQGHWENDHWWPILCGSQAQSSVSFLKIFHETEISTNYLLL